MYLWVQPAGNEMILEDALTTRTQRYLDKKRDRMFISRAVIKSPSFLSLRIAAACQVYLIFLTKCQWEKAQIKPGSRDKAWLLVNNGQIQFSYKEAREHYGISATRFTRAIDELVRVGLIDIAHSGFGLHKDVTLYAISERWQKYGTDEFEHRERPKRSQKIGFKCGNRHGRNCKPKKNSAVIDNSCSTVIDDGYVPEDTR